MSEVQELSVLVSSEKREMQKTALYLLLHPPVLSTVKGFELNTAGIVCSLLE